MIRVITITQQSGSDGTQLASLIARKFGWELLDYHLVDQVARIVDMEGTATGGFDQQEARWWRGRDIRGLTRQSLVPPISRRVDEVDEDRVHPLATQLIQQAADSGECVIVGHGAQCLLQGRADVFNVLAYTPLETSPGLQARWPEHLDVPALLRWMDSQRAEYVRHYYRRDWLDPMLYDLCVNTSIGLDRAATLITDAVVFPDTSWPRMTEEEVLS